MGLLHPDALGSLAQERTRGLLADGRAARRRREARVRLRDGSRAVVRPLRGDDAVLVADVFAQLSEQSRRLRFLTGKSRLTDRELSYLSTVDHHDHEALAAVDPHGCGLGIARFVRSKTDPHSAELAIEVVDEWHRRGVATQLLARLIDRARQEGIRRFEADVDDGNTAVLALMSSLGLRQRLLDYEDHVLRYELAISA